MQNKVGAKDLDSFWEPFYVAALQKVVMGLYGRGGCVCVVLLGRRG